jgi:(E)-4-hydroxy-3-methylbut-2-enyl-diphosphate synthase
VIRYAKEVRERTKEISAYVKIAVMGCVVNGPGEAKEADLGLAFGASNAALFEKGVITQTVKEDEAICILLEKLDELLKSKH